MNLFSLSYNLPVSFVKKEKYNFLTNKYQILRFLITLGHNNTLGHYDNDMHWYRIVNGR